MKTLICNCRFNFLAQVQVQGDSGGLGLGYVDINSVSFGGYPETELSQHNPVRDHQNHPVKVSETDHIGYLDRYYLLFIKSIHPNVIPHAYIDISEGTN